MKYFLVLFLISPLIYGRGGARPRPKPKPISKPKPRPAANCIQTFEHSNYRGKRWDFFCGKRTHRWNDKISSLKIPKNKIVRICEHSRGRGYCQDFVGNIRNLGRRMNNKGSWLVVRSYNPSQCIFAYTDSGYRGESFPFCPGRTKPIFRNWNDKISSIKIPHGHKVKVCKHVASSQGRPPCRSYFKNVANLGDFFNDQISYVKWGRFNFDDYSMIFASDPQVYWACATRECKDRASGEKNQGSLSNSWHYQSMQKLANSIGASKFAGAIFNGDLTAFGHKEEYDKYIDYYENKSTFNLWPGLGNHDYANNINDCSFNNCAMRMVNYLKDRVKSLNVNRFDYYEGKTHYKFPNLRKYHTGSLAYSFTIGKYHFIQLNNYPSYETSFNGWNFSKARRDYVQIRKSFDWLKYDLYRAKKAGKKIIINMHDTRQHFKSSDRSTFYNILKDYPVVAIFAGHIHQHYFYTYSEYAGTKKIPVFRSGSAQYNKYLRVNFRKDRIEVYTIDSVLGRTDVMKGPYVIDVD